MVGIIIRFHPAITVQRDSNLKEEMRKKAKQEQEVSTKRRRARTGKQARTGGNQEQEASKNRMPLGTFPC